MNWGLGVVDAFETRSAGAPLQITLGDNIGNMNISVFHEATSGFLTHRITSIVTLDLDFRPQRNIPGVTSTSRLLDDLWNAEPSSIENLSLKFDGPHGVGFSSLGEKPFGNVSRFRTMHLIGFSLPKPIDCVPHLRLTSLRLVRVRGFDRKLSLQALSAFLSQMPNLEEFILVGTAFEAPPSTSRVEPVARVALPRCQKLDISLDEFVSPTRFFSALEFPTLSIVRIKCEEVPRAVAFSPFQHLPEYIQSLALHSTTLLIEGGRENMVAKYYIDEDVLMIEDDTREAHCIFDIDVYGSSKSSNAPPQIHPIINSALHQLPATNPFFLILDQLIVRPDDELPSVDNWRSLFRAYPRVVRLEIRCIKKISTTNWIKALADTLLCPDLERLDIFAEKIDVKELKKTFTRRKAHNLLLKELYLWDDAEIGMEDKLEGQQVASDCVEDVWTDFADIQEL